MYLHENKQMFRQVISLVHSNSGVASNILEKDYYITLILKELTLRPNQGHAYFKGGTALYKALKSIKRFSEDIDLTIFIEDCKNPSQAKKRLEDATLKYKCLPKGESINNKGNITCNYHYDTLYSFGVDDSLNRTGNIKVEGTSFTISEPTKKIMIAPYLYELANDEQKRILSETYHVEPFEIETITLERIFVDKIFASEYYYVRDDLFNVAKHIYDITILMRTMEIENFLNNKEMFKSIVSINRKEELNRKGGIPSNQEIKDFRFFKELKGKIEFTNTFNNMQRVYVLNSSDTILEGEVFDALNILYNKL